MKSNRLKVWFNPEKGWYEVFMPDGRELPALLEITVCDNFDKGEAKAVINAQIKVVNEKPKVSSD